MLLSGATDRESEEARFRGLFEAHYRAIARYFLTRGHGAAEADDLVAATFEVAWRRLDAVPDGGGAVPWLFTVARNHSRNARRKTQREATFVADLAPTVSVSTELGAERAQEFNQVVQALGQLGALDRDMILLVSWDQLSVSDAGQVLGLRPNTARTRLHRARQRLAALLETTASTAEPSVAANRPGGGSHDA